MTVYYHRGDLPQDVVFAEAVAVDTETMGLSLKRDRLCVVQLSGGDGDAHVVQVGGQCGYDAVRLKQVLADPALTKIFHYARFDLAQIYRHFGVWAAPVYCTKIASKLSRTNTDRHGLKSLASDLLGTSLDKEQQTSDWGAETLSPQQLVYAASDVLHLHALRAILDGLLAREGRTRLAAACFAFLPARAELDLLDWAENDVFTH